MRIVLGYFCTSLWIIYAGQVISVVKPELAQRLGLQEKSAAVDPLFSCLEQWTARWDLVLLWILPAAGILMLIDHPWWPHAALIGGATYLDTGGREAAKALGLREWNVRTGSLGERRLLLITYMFFLAIGATSIVFGLMEVAFRWM